MNAERPQAGLLQAAPLAGRRIVVAPNEIAGVSSRLARAMAATGAEVRCFFGRDHPFHTPLPDGPGLRRWFRRAIGWASRARDAGGPGAAAGSLVAGVCKLLGCLRAWAWADTLVMVGGRGFFGGGAEYALARALGRRVVHVFVGTASRPRIMAGDARSILREDGVDEGRLRRLIERTRRQRRRVAAISRQAWLVVENPLCGHFHSRPFLNWFKLGLPLDVAALEAEPRITDRTPPRQPGRVRVLHGPSRPAIKGTETIRAVVRRLEAEGLPIEYREVTGVPHGQMLHEIAECDLVIDQLWSDTPMAGFAAEASALGKPVIVGGLGWDELRRWLRPEEFPPTIAIHPDRLEAVVRELVPDAERRREAGRRAREFLLQRWSPGAFAERWARVLRGEAPEDWWVRPEEIGHVHGMGLSAEEVRRIAQAAAPALDLEALGWREPPRWWARWRELARA
ncbi:MAG: hypothetical protein D6766_09610 [Verrucomicrobia bacterium]|nr:MAG: hypothetical protein D6766_09610 [Verrucomicrobiota bacterium]